MTVTASPLTAEPWIQLLAGAIEDGLILVRPTYDLDFASGRAFELLGVETSDDLAVCWELLRPSIEENFPCDGRAGGTLEIEVGEGQRKREIRIDGFSIEEETCEGLLLVIKDMKLIRALERDLRLASRMRRISKFYASSAHDLKAPLNALTLNVDLLQHAVGEDGGKTDAKEYVAALRHEISRLDRMLQAFFAQAHTNPRRHTFDLRRLVRQVLELLKTQLDAAGVGVETRFPDHSCPVRAVRDDLREAIANVLANAIEASCAGDTIEVSVDCSESEVVIEVADRGPGIDPALHERVFEMHFTTKESGSGIGLFVARTVVTHNGGGIELANREGGGLQVRVVLPNANRESDV